MKKLLLTLLTALALWPAAAAEAVWQTDLPKALAQAKAEKKPPFKAAPAKKNDTAKKAA